MIGPAVLRAFWKPIAILLIVVVLFLAWRADRAWQYRAGVNDMRREFDQAITTSRDLTNEQEDGARAAATAAARSVCSQAGLDPRDCDGL